MFGSVNVDPGPSYPQKRDGNTSCCCLVSSSVRCCVRSQHSHPSHHVYRSRTCGGGGCLRRCWHGSWASLPALWRVFFPSLFWEIHFVNLNSARCCSLEEERLTAYFISGAGFVIVRPEPRAVLNLAGLWPLVCCVSLFMEEHATLKGS